MASSNQMSHLFNNPQISHPISEKGNSDFCDVLLKRCSVKDIFLSRNFPVQSEGDPIFSIPSKIEQLDGHLGGLSACPCVLLLRLDEKQCT